MIHPIIDMLSKQTENLLFMSESDYPLEPFCWEQQTRGDEISEADVCMLTQTSTETPIEKMDFSAFFAPATTMEDWFGEEEKESATKFQDLAKTLQANLTELTVFKIGDTKKEVYIVGKTLEGNLAGVKTQVVET